MICPEFHALDGPEMKAFIVKMGRCLICAAYHPNGTCRQPNYNCRHCQGNHITAICKAVTPAPEEEEEEKDDGVDGAAEQA